MKTTFLLLILGISSFAFGQNGQSYNNGNITASSSDCSVANSCVMLGLANDDSSASITVTGTFSATLQFEVSANYSCTQAGVCSGTWFSKQCFPESSSTGATSATSTGLWTCTVAAKNRLRVRGSAYVSGTAVIDLYHSKASASLNQGGGGGSGTVTVKSSGSLTDTAFVTGNGTTVVQTPSATSTLDSSGNASFVGTVTAASDGVHAGALGLIGNTTVPTLTSNNFHWIGPNSASFTAWGIQMASTENASAGIFHVGAVSGGHISQGTVSALVAADLPNPTFGSSTSVTAVCGQIFEANGGSTTVTMPTPSNGCSVCVRNADNQTNVITFAATASVQYENTARTSYGTANHKMVSGGAVTDQVCWVGNGTTKWDSWSPVGTWTDTP